MRISQHSQSREVEAAYRRGYAQGAYIALEAHKEAIDPSRIAKWFDAVVKWRYDLSETKTPSKNGTGRGWCCPPEPFKVEPQKQAAVMRQGGHHA